MKKLTLAVIAAAMLLTATTTASGSTQRTTCWKATFTFLNYPSHPSSFATWSFTRREHSKPLPNGEGEFSFAGDAGGGAQRSVTRCFASINPYVNHPIWARLHVAVYADCPDCKFLISLERTR